MNTRNRITYNNDIGEQFDPKHKYSNTFQSKGEKTSIPSEDYLKSSVDIALY